MNYIVTFENARQVIKADAACSANGISATVITVPEDISTECGMCLRLESHELERFEMLMRKCNLKVKIHAR